MNINEEGNVTIESIIVLPIATLLVLSFIYLFNLISLSDQVSVITINKLVCNQKNEYEENGLDIENKLVSNAMSHISIELLRNNIELSLNKLNSNRFNITDVETYEYGDDIFASCKYKYIFPLKILNIYECNNTWNLRAFRDGDLLENYSAVSERLSSIYDVWSMKNIDRAHEIVKILGGYQSFDGSSIDKIEKGRLVSIVSLDYRKASYTEYENIFSKLKYDIEKLNNFKEGKIANENITKKDYTGKMFHLVIPDGEITKELENELIRIRTYCTNYNIEFKVTMLKGGENEVYD